MASFPLNVIRKAFSVGEVVAPAIAGRAAFELFCRTPDPKSPTPGERKAVFNAAEFMSEARQHCLKMRAGTVKVYEFRPIEPIAQSNYERRTVLMIHGWRSRTEYMRGLIAGYRDAGFRVVSLDLPGHGGSSGRRLNMALAVESARVAADWFGPFAAIVGHSFGGAVAVNAAVGSVDGIAPVRTDKIVTIASPSSMPGLFTRFGKMIGAGPRTQAVIGGHVKRVTGRELATFETVAQLRELPQSVLVIHDEDDAEVPVSEARLTATAGERVELFITQGLGHRRIITDQQVISKAIGFVVDDSGAPAIH